MEPGMSRPSRRRPARHGHSDDTLRGRLEWLAFAALVAAVYLWVPVSA